MPFPLLSRASRVCMLSLRPVAATITKTTPVSPGSDFPRMHSACPRHRLFAAAQCIQGRGPWKRVGGIPRSRRLVPRDGSPSGTNAGLPRARGTLRSLNGDIAEQQVSLLFHRLAASIFFPFRSLSCTRAFNRSQVPLSNVLAALPSVIGLGFDSTDNC